MLSDWVVKYTQLIMVPTSSRPPPPPPPINIKPENSGKISCLNYCVPYCLFYAVFYMGVIK